MINAPRAAANSYSLSAAPNTRSCRSKVEMLFSKKSQLMLFSLDIQPFGLMSSNAFSKTMTHSAMGWPGRLWSFLRKNSWTCLFSVMSSIHMARSSDLSRYFTPANLLSRGSLSAPVERRICSSSVVLAHFQPGLVKRHGNRAP